MGAIHLFQPLSCNIYKLPVVRTLRPWRWRLQQPCLHPHDVVTQELNHQHGLDGGYSGVTCFSFHLSDNTDIVLGIAWSLNRSHGAHCVTVRAKRSWWDAHRKSDLRVCGIWASSQLMCDLYVPFRRIMLLQLHSPEGPLAVTLHVLIRKVFRSSAAGMPTLLGELFLVYLSPSIVS
jgi:hypothetical protein